jgi:hypothetical protein
LSRNDIGERSVQCPVPVRNPEPCSSSLEPLPEAGIGVFLGDRDDMLIEGLLVQSNVWPVPSREDDRAVSAVATKGTIGANAVVGPVWPPVNSRDLEVGLGIILIDGLETSKRP